MDVSLLPGDRKRVVIIGGGFGGLQLAKGLSGSPFEVVLIDRNNFHQFQPLFYQVATSGLEPSSIIFPFRKIFQRSKNVFFRLAEVKQLDTENAKVVTDIGEIAYDHLIIATGAGNNFFGNENIRKFAVPMKSINESLHLRNLILERFEQSLNVPKELRSEYLTFVIAGGGPTGTELAGTLAEMKRYILPKDYPELDFHDMDIVLVEGAPRVLNAMSELSSKKAHQYLEKLGVKIMVNTRVNDYEGNEVALSNEEHIRSKTLIWAAGIQGNFLDGLPEETRIRGNRIKVDGFNRVEGIANVYAIGDVAYMEADPDYPHGHPQLAQVAIQQAKRVGKNLRRLVKGEPMQVFHYRNLGSMATVGRNKAVVELPRRKFYGFFAWLVWMLVHLRSILGIKNKWVVFMNWVWNYFTYNLSLRVIIRRNDDRDQPI